MSHSKRLLLCRLALVVLCIVPTLLVGGWILIRSLSGYAAASKAEWQRELTSRLGLIAEIDELHYSRPDVAQLVGLKLLDPETRGVVAEARQIDIAATPTGWQVAAKQLALDGNKLALLGRLIDQRILRGTMPSDAGKRSIDVSLILADAIIRTAAADQTLEQLTCDVQLSSGGATFLLSFQLPGSPTTSNPVRLAAIRERGPPAGLRWQLETGGSSIPCRLLADLLPQLAHLGSDCHFSGTVQLGDSPAGASGQVAGTLARIDLDSLISEQFPHQLSGSAAIRIDDARLAEGQLTVLRGTIQAQHGTISPSLVAAAAQHLDLHTAEESASGLSPISFRQMAIGFELTGQSLALTGSADPTTAGALLANASGPILSAPPHHGVAAVNLLRTLLPESEFQVPAARQTARLVRLFPLPDIVPSAARLAGHTPTRLAPAPPQPRQAAVRPPVLR